MVLSFLHKLTSVPSAAPVVSAGIRALSAKRTPHAPPNSPPIGHRPPPRVRYEAMVNVPLRCTSGDEAPGHGLTDAIPLLSPFGLAAIRRPADKRSRPQRWRDAVPELVPCRLTTPHGSTGCPRAFARRLQ